jgi:hypothetical protein
MVLYIIFIDSGLSAESFKKWEYGTVDSCVLDGRLPFVEQWR